MNLVGKEYKLPIQVVVLVLFLCLIPLLLTLAGVDFGKNQTPIPQDFSKLSTAEFENEIFSDFYGPIIYGILDWISITFLLSTVLFAFFHYSFSHNAMILLMGIMLLFAATGDALQNIHDYHLVGTTLDSNHFIPFIWVITRLIRFGIWSLGIGIFLYFGIKKIVLHPYIFVLSIFSVCVLSILVVMSLSTIENIPEVHFPDQILKRPWDLIPLAFVLFVGFPLIYKFNQAYPSYFAHGLLLALIPTALGEIYLILGSDYLYDNEFMIAMYLRVIASFTMLLGVCYDYLRAHQEKDWAYSELKKAVKQRDKAQLAKLRFVDHFRDQIRKPMNGVMGVCNLLLQTNLDQNQRKLGRIISQSSGKLLGIIGEIIDLSKVSHNNLDVENILFDLKKFIIEIIENFQIAAKEKNIRLHVSIAQNIPSFVYGDVEKIRHIMLSILSDVIRYAKNSDVSIALTGNQLEKEYWNFVLIIEYIQAVIPTKIETTEVLTFSYAFELSKKIGGSIDLEKKDGNNSIVKITLPLKIRKESDIPSNLSEFLLGYKGLIVESDDIDRAKVIDIVTAFGMQYKAVKDAQEALDLIKSGEGFDIFIISHSLPDVDAMQLIDQLRTYPEGLTGAMIVVISEVENQKFDEKKYNLKKILRKPVYPSHLFLELSDIVYKENPTYMLKEKSSQTFPEPYLAPLDVLLFEDDYVNQYVIKRYLEHYGCNVDIVSSEAQLLEICSYKDFSCIIIDCTMLNMKIADIVRGIKLKKHSVVIVGLTTDSIPESNKICKELGIDIQLSKPIIETEFISILQKIKEKQLHV